MGKRGVGSKRRTVVQLDDRAQKQPTYGLGYRAQDEPPKSDGRVGALSGLMSHYAQDSDSGEDSDDDVAPPAPSFDSAGPLSGKSGRPLQRFVAATDTGPPRSPADTSASSEVSAAVTESSTSQKVMSSEVGKEKPADDIDTKLQDFLAEIESIDTVKEVTPAGEESIDGVAVQNGSESKAKHESKTVAEKSVDLSGGNEDEEWKVQQPKEPYTVWQQCLDDETQCYYYWNFKTNAVTWEIPPEYSQYLLLYQEYEQALARYRRDYAEWKKTHSHRRHHKKRHKRSAKSTEEVCTPLVSYPPADDDEADQKSAAVYGPFLPAAKVSSSPEVKQEMSSAVVIGPVIPDDTSGAQSAVSSGTKVREDSKKASVKLAVATVEDGGECDADKLKALHEKFVRRTRHSKESTLERTNKVDSDSAEVADPVSTTSSTTDFSEKSSKRDANKNAKLEPGTSSLPGQEQDHDDHVGRVMEEPVFVRYEYTNKKYEGDVPEVERLNVGEDLDLDDIDKELEMALERRKLKTGSQYITNNSARPEDVSDMKMLRVDKRKAFDDAECSHRSKKLKTEAEVMPESPLRRITREDVRNKVAELAEVGDLASVIHDKLDFLEVTRTGLSNLQVLLVQTETRIQDWHAGALSTERLLEKLRESCATLHQYELTATPPGWSCYWHRSYRRYFYCHDTTGETRWDYPDGTELVTEPVKEENVEGPSAEEHQEEMETTTTEVAEIKPDTSSSSPADVHDSISTSPVMSCSGPVVSLPVSLPCSEQALLSTKLVADVVVCKGEPPPPGTEPPLPLSLPCDLLSLAACPPPPPPMSPPVAVENDDVPTMDLNEEVLQEEDLPPVLEAVKSFSDEVEDAAVEDDEETVLSGTSSNQAVSGVEICAPPVLNRVTEPSHVMSSSPTRSIGSPTPDTGCVSPLPDVASPGAHDGAPFDEAQHSSAAPQSHGKERKKKKDKGLVAGGLTLKKKNVSSMVEKWQKVQRDVTEELTKEELKKLKKSAAGLE